MQRSSLQKLGVSLRKKKFYEIAPRLEVTDRYKYASVLRQVKKSFTVQAPAVYF